MTHIKNLSRAFGTRVLAMAVFLITSVVLVNAAITVTVPNAASFPFNLPAGGTMAIAVPAVNQPVLLMGATYTVGDRGVGHVSLLRASSAPAFLMWTGLESQPSAITQGFSAALGTHIVFIDFAHDVDVEVHSAAAIRVHNQALALRTGRVTMIW